MQNRLAIAAVCLGALMGVGNGLTACSKKPMNQPPPGETPGAQDGFDSIIQENARRMMEEGRQTFRFDSFGNEAFWGGSLRLHESIAGAKHGGQGPGVSPRTALAVGLKVDVEALPDALVEQLRNGQVDLDDPATTLALLQQNAVVGLKGIRGPGGELQSVGITCALCHSTVDDSFAPGIGKRRDGWPSRDLDVGKIIALAPNLQPFADLLKVDVATVTKVLLSWGPGKFDALLDKDGKAFRPDGRPAATLIPPAYGLAGVNLHTWTGMGSVPYWNAYVATTEMHSQGTFFDERLKDPRQYPVAARTGSWNTRGTPDLVTSKLAALHFYQLAIPAPRPAVGSFDQAAFERGEHLFNAQAKCATCHVPPLFTEPGNNLHEPADIGIDSFQADRSPTHGYRTTPLRGLWARQKGGFYHDGRFATLGNVVEHYDRHLKLGLVESEKKDLVQYLLGL